MIVNVPYMDGLIDLSGGYASIMAEILIRGIHTNYTNRPKDCSIIAKAATNGRLPETYLHLSEDPQQPEMMLRCD
jgi:hypothetical protein